MRAIYPGSFDPVTFGHLDIICRSSKIADELIIGVLKNNAKSPLFSLEERVKMLEEVTKDYHNVKVVPFEGLLVDFAKNMKADIVVRGLRAITDFDLQSVYNVLSCSRTFVFISSHIKFKPNC